MTTTDGTASPRAQGHEATKIDIALSKGKHHTQYSSIVTQSIPTNNNQTAKTRRARIITPFTK